jgi:DMSO/TMAO reductase YedYZ molybdopterin-dependent catalytic subunit
MSATLRITRRNLMKGTAAAAGVAVTGLPAGAQETGNKLPGYVDWKDADALIVHSDNTVETTRAAIGAAPVTPTDRLYIRNNIAPPPDSIVADRDAWSVEFEGVKEPRSITVGELKTMGLETVPMVLECSGNGRAFFEHETSGTQWRVGAAGNVFWTGVPLRKVIEALGGVADGAQYITSTGGEELPQEVDRLDVLVERSVPVDVQDNVLLAWDLNGEPIPLAHGGPLRVIVPGFTGVNNVKYVKKIALTPEQSPARIQQSRYRLVPLGEESGPQHPSVWQMQVKSFVTAPLEKSKAGTTQISGVAYGGINAVSSVEVSVDGGKTWEKAEFAGPEIGRYAWRPFVLSKDLEPGTYMIMSRATDSEGNTQPEAPEPNRSGYTHNGWRAHGVEVTVS